MVEVFSHKQDGRPAIVAPTQEKIDIDLSAKQLSRIGFLITAVVIFLRVAFYFLQSAEVMERSFVELYIAGIALMLLPAFGHKRISIWVALVMAWISMFEMGLFASSRLVYTLCGYILITLIAMIMLQDRTWQYFLVVSLVAISYVHGWQLRGGTATMTMKEVRTSWALQVAFLLAAAFIMAMVFQQLRKILTETTLANKQLSLQRASLETYSAELEQLNEKLVSSEARAATIMNVSLDTTLLISPTGRIVGANNTACEKLGYSREELLNLSLTDIDSNVSEEAVREVFQHTFSGESVLEQISEHTTSNGGRFPVEVRSRHVMVGGEQIMYSTARDISKRLAMQEAREEADRELKAQTEFLSLITNNLPARIAYVDRFGMLQFFNPEFAEKYNFTDKRTPFHLSTNADKERAATRKPYVQRVMEHGETVAFEMNETSFDGREEVVHTVIVPHIVDDVVMGRFSLGLDVTELRTAEASLAQANRILEHVNENMPARITYFDADGVVIFSNRNPDLVGQTQRSILGCDKALSALDGYDATVLKHNALAFAGEAGTYEIRRLDSNGNELVEMVRYVPHHEDNALAGIFVLVSDVTDARRTEEALQQAQKLESLGVLAGGIAHDFNNLLVGILGQSSIALVRMDEAHPSRKHILRSMNAAERASSLTKQMLAYSGRGSFTVAALDVNALIQQNLDLLTVTLPKSVKLTTALAEELPMIDADAAQMQQLIMNLLINAGQAIGEHEGSIVVETGEKFVSAETDDFAKFTGKPLQPGNYSFIRIKDDGKGMTPETVEHIFDPFYTTKENGSGLGLAAVLGIIRGHNGGIRLSSTPGQGTEFHLMFPVLERADRIDIEPKQELHSMQQEESLVLVIDDEVDVLEVVADMLELEEIATLTSTRGAEGIEIFRANQDKISLVLLDLMMPGMNGEETFSALREIDPNIRVVLSSGYSEAEATRRFVGNKLADFIQKPYDFQQLTDKVKSVLEGPELATE